jgi:hypothetical protein
MPKICFERQNILPIYISAQASSFLNKHGLFGEQGCSANPEARLTGLFHFSVTTRFAIGFEKITVGYK